jgi:DNA-binding response OmpR family regulator
VESLAELEEGSQVVLVDHFTVAAEEVARFRDSWARDVERMKRHDGFVSARLRPTSETADAYVSVVVWRTAQALRNSLSRRETPTVAGHLERHAASVHRFGVVEVDPAAREVRKAGRLVRLTFKEFELLLALVTHPRRVFARDELMDRVWGYRAALETGTLSVHMRRLRMKLEDDPADPRHLETVWGVGYRFMP